VNHQIRLSESPNQTVAEDWSLILDKLYITVKTKCLSYLSSSTTMDHIPSTQSETPRTMQSSQIIADLHQTCSENLDILQSPQLPTNHQAFHCSLEEAWGWVDMLDMRGDTERPVGQHLAKWQEIIAYRTSQLFMAVKAWLNALYCEDYDRWRGHWLTELLGEVVSLA
jgi:hypothetical protein